MTSRSWRFDFTLSTPAWKIIGEGVDHTIAPLAIGNVSSCLAGLTMVGLLAALGQFLHPSRHVGVQFEEI